MAASGSDVLLVVVDQAERDRLIRPLLEVGRTVTGTSSFHDARQRLEHDPPRVLISDIRLGAYNGMHLALLSMHTRVAGVFLLDDNYDRMLATQSVQWLAQYLVKPVDPPQVCGHVSDILRSHGSGHPR